jgi:hypothetical protein
MIQTDANGGLVLTVSRGGLIYEMLRCSRDDPKPQPPDGCHSSW